MNTRRWFLLLSTRQRIWLAGTAAAALVIIGVGVLVSRDSGPESLTECTIDMSLREIAPTLKVTGKALARELELPLSAPKSRPLRALGVRPETLQHAVDHLLSHRDTPLKYYVYGALVLCGLVFLTRLGRPDLSSVNHRREWFPRGPYVASLIVSASVAGFLLGKSPNPMEGTVKVLKSMVGLYPDPTAKVVALLFFIALAIVGNKLICGWACPFGALQELIYSLPILKRMKQRKLPFAVTNTIRTGLLAIMLLFLFGIIGGRQGTVIYHYINPFNLFNFDFESTSILLAVVLALSGSFFVYRPFCQFVCPFGLISWIGERFSIFRVQIDTDKCNECGACLAACPLEAAKGRVHGSRLPADCFSCGRCLNVCPADAISYR